MYKIPDWQLDRMIKTARFLLKMHNDWHRNIDDDTPWSEGPNYYLNYLYLKGIIKEVIKERREHNEAMAKVWGAYADAVLRQRGIDVTV